MRRGKFSGIAKIAILNIVVLGGLLLLVNFGAVVVSTVHGLFPDKTVDNRATLPNYDMIPWAETHFREFRELSTQYRSFVGWRRRAYAGTTVTVDENGIRQTPQYNVSAQIDNPDTRPLVVFLGGSTMWGTGVNDRHTIPARVSVHAKGAVRTLNFGESGFTAFQEFVFLSMQLHDGVRPAAVVAYDGVNELKLFRKEITTMAHSREGQIQAKLENPDVKLLNFRTFFIGPIESFVAKYRRRFGSRAPEYYTVTPERTDWVARQLLNSWKQMKAVSQAFDAEFVCVLQPNALVGRPNVSAIKGTRRFLPDPAYKAIYSALYPKIRELIQTPEFASLRPHFLDLSGLFDDGSQVYIDYCHLSPNGNDRVARALLAALHNLKVGVRMGHN